MPDFTLREKANCADREVRQRQRVYPRLVAAERMSQQQASREIACMEAIAKDLGELADAEEAMGRLI